VHRAPRVLVRVAPVTLVTLVTLLSIIFPARAWMRCAPRTERVAPLPARPSSTVMGLSVSEQSSGESAEDERTAPWTERDEEDAVDLYGNDVSDAVATYKLDSDGSLYELHSPRTELPRLSSPKG